jgi:hypothetical protein
MQASPSNLAGTSALWRTLSNFLPTFLVQKREVQAEVLCNHESPRLVRLLTVKPEGWNEAHLLMARAL